MRKTSFGFARVIGIGSLVFPVLVGCGDNIGADGNIDARVTADGSTTDPDANVVATATRGATIAITEVRLTDNLGPTTIFSGASFSLGITDLSGANVAPVYGDGSVGTCTVYKYKVGTNAPPPNVDEGAITIGGAGLLKPNPNPCTFSATAGRYLCVAGGGAAPAGTVASAGTGTASISIDGATFNMATQAQVGMYIQITGADVAGFNGVFPVVGVQNATTLAIAGAIPATAPGTAYTATSYGLLQGQGPVPGTAAVKYLDDDATAPDPVTVTMAPSAAYPDGINAEIMPIGAGFSMAETQPQNFPFTAPATPLKFSCELPTANGVAATCGNNPTSGTTQKVLIVTGSTTSGSVAGLPPYAMPPTADGNEYTTFQCSFIESGGKRGEIPVAAVQAILNTTPAPTRIETRVIRANGNAGAQGANKLNVLVGHALVGHSTALPD